MQSELREAFSAARGCSGRTGWLASRRRQRSGGRWSISVAGPLHRQQVRPCRANTISRLLSPCSTTRAAKLAPGTAAPSPHDRLVLAVENSASMRPQRPVGLTRRSTRRPSNCPSTTVRSMRRWRRSRSTSGPTSIAALPRCVASPAIAWSSWPSTRARAEPWGFVDDADEERIVADLARMLESGEWDRRWGGWRRREFFEGSLRLIVADVSH